MQVLSWMPSDRRVSGSRAYEKSKAAYWTLASLSDRLDESSSHRRKFARSSRLLQYVDSMR